LRGERRVAVRRKTVSGIMLSLLLIGMLILTFNIQPVKASGTIYIRADGSVDPSTANITSSDNITYTFTGDIYDSIVVERDNIVVDGAGYTFRRIGNETGGIGIDLSYRSNVTIKSMEIKAYEDLKEFDYGIYLYLSSNNIISGNNITNNWNGIWLEDSSNNIISGNNITANNEAGITLVGSSSNNIISGNNIIAISHWVTWGIGVSSNNNTVSGNNIRYYAFGIILWDSLNNRVSGNNITNSLIIGIWLRGSSSNSIIYHNNFIDNDVQASIEEFSSNNTWDDGYPSSGNYWSDYTGVDLRSGRYQNMIGGDGILDTPYVIDENNTDHYPLVSPYWYWSNPITGDLNKDMVVNIDDVMIPALAYGSYPGHPKWNPIADLTGDELVDIDDVMLVAIHYGEHI